MVARRAFAVLFAVILGGFAGCPDSGSPRIGALDTVGGDIGGDVEDVAVVEDLEGDAEIGGVAEVEMELLLDVDVYADAEVVEGVEPGDVAWEADVVEVDVPVRPQGPVLAFYFVTASGEKGKDEDQVDLSFADEPEAYKATPGFQVDIVVETQRLETGQMVTLNVAGQNLASLPVSVDEESGIGEVRFEAITLTHNTDGYVVSVTAKNVAGLEGSASKTVRVDLGTCGVMLFPENTTCVLEDADPLAPGAQVGFTVTNPERSCDKAMLFYSVAGGEQQALGPVDLDEDGSASFVVTLPEDLAPWDGVGLVVVGQVQDSANPDRTASTHQIPFVVDLADPTVTFAKPDKGFYTLADDKDGDLTNGLTVGIEGQAAGISPNAAVTLEVNDEFSVEIPTDDEGRFAYDFNVTRDGSYQVVGLARDSCGRVGSASVTFEAKVSFGTWTILNPSDGATLYAKDDQNKATGLIYETTFTIAGTGVSAGTEATVVCRQAAGGAPFVAVGSVVVGGDGQYEVVVALDVELLTQNVRCRVQDNAVNPGVSAEIGLTVALPAPLLRIVKPKAGDAVNGDVLAVDVETSGLAGIKPTVQLRDELGQVIATYDVPEFGEEQLSSFDISIAGMVDGTYTLYVDATDTFGNVASDIEGNVTEVSFVIDRTPPTLAFSRPAEDVLALTFVDDEDASAPGLQYTLEVAYSGLEAGAEISVKYGPTGGALEEVVVQAPEDAGDGETKFVTVGRVTLLDGEVYLSISASDAAGNFTRFERTIFVWSQPVKVEFDTPKDGDVLNLAYPACGVGIQDCVLDVKVLTQNAPDGSEAILEVVCGTAPVATYTAQVSAGAAVFDAVVLTDQSECTLQVTVTVGGLIEAIGGPITVRVDRIAPEVTLTRPADATLSLVAADDEDASAPGLQYTLEVTYSGLEAGRQITVAYGVEGGAITVVEAQAPEAAADGEFKVVGIGPLTLPDGNVVLAVETSDEAGNSADFSRQIFVWSGQPVLSIYEPLFVANQPCSSSSDCAGGVCAEGYCAVGWGLASDRRLGIVLVGAPAWPENVRICSDKAGLGAEPCAKAGFGEVARGTVVPDGTTQYVDLSALQDGYHTLIAEAYLAPGQPWVSSEAAAPGYQRRYIYQDLVSPKVLNLYSPSDIRPPSGYLNAAEQKAPGRVYEIAFEASEQGKAAVYVDGVLQAEIAVSAGLNVTDVTFADEGQREVYVVLSDIVGNSSPIPPEPDVLYYKPIVDTVSPTLAIVTASVIKHGESQDLVIESDAIGRTVTVYDFGTWAAEGQVGPDGKLVLAFIDFPILMDGAHEITAEVTDEAGNVTTTTKQIFVDTVVPDVILESPQDLGTLSDGDDVEPSQPGFQILLRFGSGSSDAASYKVEVALNCDSDFATCDAPITLASGLVTNPGGLEPDLVRTVPLGTTHYYLFSVSIFDAIGNVGVAIARVTLDLQPCTVSFSGFEPFGFINNGLCPTPGEDCDEVTVNIGVNASPGCGTVDKFAFLVDGSQLFEQDFSTNPVTFDHQFSHGTTPQLEARVYENGVEKGSTGPVPVTVDLKNPAVAFTLPPAGSSNAWGVADDEDVVQEGLQKSLKMEAQDENLIGGKIQALIYIHDSGTDELSPVNIAIPYTFTENPAVLDFQRVTLRDQSEGTVRVEVEDAAGNRAVSEFSVVVDLIPPAAPELQVVSVNPRRPAVTLRWLATGDNGNEGKAAAYDIRYSTSPIVTNDDFETSCEAKNLAYVSSVPVPGEPGTEETYTVTGPDIRPPDVQEHGKPCKLQTGVKGFAQYYVAVRTVDKVGNKSPVVATSVVPVDFALRYAKFIPGSPWTQPEFQRRVWNVGDINGDGLADVAVSSGNAAAFCVIYGHSSGQDKSVDHLTFTGLQGDHHKCIQGASGSFMGVPVAALGDVNGDGYDDIGVGAGIPNSYAHRLFVYLGSASGIGDSPDVTIIGFANHIAGVSAAGNGDFDGDGLKDIVVGSSGTNQAFIIPGSTAWTRGANITIDVASAVDRLTYRVVTLELSGLDELPPESQPTYYGANVDFVRDVDLDGYDEVAVVAVANMNPSAVLVTRGRAVNGPITLIASLSNNGTGDDAHVVRLQPDATSKGYLGAASLSGLWDLDGDGRGDVIAGHAYELSTGQSRKSIYVFYGSYMASHFGKWIRIAQAPQPPQVCEDGIYRNERGFTICGLYDRPSGFGNLDDDQIATPSVELGYTLYSTTTWGKVFVRLNLVDPSGQFGQGAFPYQSPVLVDPENPEGTTFGRFRAVGIGDFNGDGFEDLLVGTSGAGYVVLLY